MNQESQTLDLTNDCFQFVTEFFEVINTSAPHIYHSALLVCPKTSIVQRLYGPQAKPLARVIQGLPTSWDLSVANRNLPLVITTAAWSPCSRFIAIVLGLDKVVVLDAMTLGWLHTMHPLDKNTMYNNLVYSPDGHLLAGYGFSQITSWDLQTGGLISNISTSRVGEYNSVVYSGCGTVLGGLFDNDTIITYDILSGTQISSHSVQEFTCAIWTCGESLQFASTRSRSIIIWEVSFTSSHPPIQISSLPVLPPLVSSLPVTNYFPRNFIFLPTLFQLAFILEDRVLVWDAQNQKILLDSIDVKNPREVSFSPNGDFFICCGQGPEFHLWKKFPDGFLPCQKFVASARGDTGVTGVISPNGELIVSFEDYVLQLWHTKNSPTISTQALQYTQDHCLEFSPDGSVVAIAHMFGNTVTVLDLKSGNPQLVIDTGIMICGVGVTESKIIVIGNGKIITWELPAGDCVLNAWGCIDNCVQTTAFECPESAWGLHASVSPNLNYIAFGDSYENLFIYDMHTGEKLAAIKSDGSLVGFTSGGNKVWHAELCEDLHINIVRVNEWTVVRGDMSNTTELEGSGSLWNPTSGFPWNSPCGYQITKNGWILSSSGRQLLWLPHQWRSFDIYRKWSGKFLALVDQGLPEAVILELEA